MSAGIDKQLVLAYYQKLSDEKLLYVLNNDAKGLTNEALEIVQEEVHRRKLNPEILKIVEKQQEVYVHVSKAFDPEACPVEEDKRIWIENSFEFLLNTFGKDATINRKILVPSRKHFPIKYDGKEAAAFETLKIVALQMEVPVEKIALDFYDENLRRITKGTPEGIYWGHGENEKFEISLAIKLLDEPENLVATLAHEIAHIKLLGEKRLEENDEPLTDLTTIFFGLGVFNANTAFQTFADFKYYGWSSSGYLSQMEWGYALSLFAYLRKEDQPAWAEYLCTNVKADFRQGQYFILNNPEKISLSV